MSLSRKAALLASWTRMRLILFLRTPRAAFFTFVFPLLLLLLINALNSGQHVTSPTSGEKVAFATYFTPSIGVFGLITGCYTAIIFALSTARDRGIIKRVMGTPLPSPVYLASWACSAIITGVASVVLLIVVGMIFFDVSIAPRLIPAAIVALLLGGLCLSSLGLAVAGFVRKAESAPMVANLTMFPLIFLSGVFFPIGQAPDLVQHIANFFPIAHIVQAFTACFDPATTGSGFTGDYWPLIAWTVVGLVVATRRFRVEMTAAGGDRHSPASAAA
jgi:ABC-2 type transport system permease protein